MRVVVTGADGLLGQGVAMRLASLGHDVTGVGSRRSESWPGAVPFVTDTNGPLRADVLAVCDPAASVPDTGARRIVVAAPLGHVETPPVGAECIVVRFPLVLGRSVDDALLRRFARPVQLRSDEIVDRPLQVVHPHDLQRVFVRAVTDSSLPAGPIEVAAAGHTTIRAIAAALGRPLLRVPTRFLPVADAGPDALLDARHLREDWGCAPAWTAAQCVDDFALVCRARFAIGNRVFALPWRLPRVREIPAVDTPSEDGVAPVSAGIGGADGEFDTPIDPRFPAFVATNLSEALPGPFSPSSASVTVRGTRAAALVISQRLRPGGAVQSEMSKRTTGVFGHRLYAGITSGHFMAQTVPLVDPDLIINGFFGRTIEGLPLFGDELPPVSRRNVLGHVRGVLTFANNLLGLTAGSGRDTRDFVGDVTRLEARAAGAADLDDQQLRELMTLARDHVVHAWVLASASILVCTAYGVILRILRGHDVLPSAGADITSAQSLGAVHRLAASARRDPTVAALLTSGDPDLDTLAERAPRFAAQLASELGVIGHRGPGEVEMRCATFSDDPRLLLRMVAKTLQAPAWTAPVHPAVPLWLRPVAAAAASQLRDREVRRDRMVRTIWLLRGLLREYGRRLVAAGTLTDPEDVFYLLVDELDASPPDVAAVVARRRAQQVELQRRVPPEAFSGRWAPSAAPTTELTSGEVLHGLGVCAGVVRGRVRVVLPETIDDLEPGEILVAKVTDVGYTPAFAYAGAVVTELGGHMSHAAIVAREFGVPCVVNARGAASRLPTGTLVEVDGGTGQVTVLAPTPDG
jgi:phosphohistidine swiveling domain-containing protein/nucleoside-diphosphate-sugar epimerase